MNALVDATPISVPARVRNASAVCAHHRLVATLQIASVCAWPSAFACFSAASVSAVSPDCDTTTTSAADCGTLSR